MDANAAVGTDGAIRELPYSNWTDWALSPPSATRLFGIGCEVYGAYEAYCMYQLAQSGLGSSKEMIDLGVGCFVSVTFGLYCFYNAHYEEKKILQNRAFFATILSPEDRRNL